MTDDHFKRYKVFKNFIYFIPIENILDRYTSFSLEEFIIRNTNSKLKGQWNLGRRFGTSKMQVIPANSLGCFPL